MDSKATNHTCFNKDFAVRRRTPAILVQDYTYNISLKSSNVLVFNALTGKAWQGPKNAIREGFKCVEDGVGFSPAFSLIRNYLRMFDSQRSSFLNFVLIPSYECNLRCDYCYEGKLTCQKRSWNVDDLRDVVSACLQIANSENYQFENSTFTFMGGEPVRDDLIPVLSSCMDMLGKHGVSKFNVITNGFELSRFAAILSQAGLTSIQVTIDGPRKVHDSRRKSRLIDNSTFDKAMEGIHLSLRLGMKVYIRVNIDQRNVNSLAELAHVFEDNRFFNNQQVIAYLYPVTSDFAGCTRLVNEVALARSLEKIALQVPQINQFRWDFHGLEFLYRLRNGQPPSPKYWFCGAHTNQYVLDVDFNLYTCWFGVNNPNFRVGFFDRYSGLLNFNKNQLYKWRHRSIATIRPCNTCKWALICGGGCGFKAFERTGILNSPNCADFNSILKTCGRLVYEESLILG